MQCFMKRDQFLVSKELKLNLMGSERKITQLRQRYQIQVVTDYKLGIVKKTFRDFQYFNTLVHEKIKLQKNQLILEKHHRNSSIYRSIQFYINQLNQGLLLYDVDTSFSLPCEQTYQLRGYLYSLLFEEDGLFVNIDQFNQDENKQEIKNEEEKIHANEGIIREKRNKSEERKNNKSKGKNGLAKGILDFVKNKRKKSIQISNNLSLKMLSDNISECWVNVPNKFEDRDRSKIYSPFHWEKYNIQILEKGIVISNSSHHRFIILYNTEIRLQLKKYSVIVIDSKIEKTPLCIRLSIQENENENNSAYARYLALYTKLKSIVQNYQSIQIGNGHEKYQQILSKFRIRLKIKKNPTSSNNVTCTAVKQPLVVKINHQSINVSVAIPYQTNLDIDLPILNNYTSIQINFTESSKNNKFSNLQIKDSSANLLIVPVQSVYDMIYNKNRIKKKVAHQSKNCNQSSGTNMINFKQKAIELKNIKAIANIEYKGLGNMLSYCQKSDLQIYEGQIPPDQLSLDDIRMSANRLKRIVWTVETFVNWGKDLKNFTYPNLSYIFYWFLLIFVFFHNNNYIMEEILTVLICILLFNNPNIHIYVSQLIDLTKQRSRIQKIKKILFTKNQYLPNDFTKPLIKKNFSLFETKSADIKQTYLIDAHDRTQYVQFIQDHAKQEFLKEFILTKKVKRSMINKYRHYYSTLLRAQYFALLITGFFEKVKNVFVWYHYEKTKFLLTFLFLVLLALLILPIRLIAILALLKMLQSGKTYHQNIQNINKLVIIELIRLIIKQNNLNIIKSHFQEMNKPFDMNNSQTQTFFKKCRQCLGNWLDIYYDADLIQCKSGDMKKLISNLSKCKKKYLIKMDVCLKYKFNVEWSRNENKINFLSQIFGFFISTPSDKYILGVKTVTVDDDEEEQPDEFLNF